MKYEQLIKAATNAEGDVNLSGTKITELSDNLSVRGNLFLRGLSGLTKLPENLKVGGWLDIVDTGITELPDSLSVGGKIYRGRDRPTTDASRVLSAIWPFPSFEPVLLSGDSRRTGILENPAFAE